LKCTLIHDQTLNAADDRFIWVAGKHSEAAAIRHLLREERGFDRKNHIISAYWRRQFPDQSGLN